MTKTIPAHGTLHRYNAYGCRCDMCRNRKSEYERDRKARHAEFNVPDITTVPLRPIPVRRVVHNPNALNDLIDAVKSVESALDDLYETHPDLLNEAT